MDAIIFELTKEKSTFQVVVGVIANATALFFYFSPLLIVYNLIKGKIKANTVPYFLLICNVANTLLWFLYGLKKEDIQVWLINTVGGSANLVYLLIYWYYFVDKKCFNYLIYCIFTFIIFGGIFCLFYFAVNKTVTGTIAMCTNIIMFAAPGQRIVSISELNILLI